MCLISKERGRGKRVLLGLADTADELVPAESHDGAEAEQHDAGAETLGGEVTLKRPIDSLVSPVSRFSRIPFVPILLLPLFLPLRDFPLLGCLAFFSRFLPLRSLSMEKAIFGGGDYGSESRIRADEKRTLYWTGSYPPLGGISWAMAAVGEG